MIDGDFVKPWQWHQGKRLARKKTTKQPPKRAEVATAGVETEGNVVRAAFGG